MSSKRKRAGMWIVVLVVMAVMVSLPIMAAPTQETPVYWESGASTTCSGHETEECEDPTSCTVTAQEDGCAVSTSGLPQSCDYRSGIIIFPFQDCRDETCTFSDYETCDDGNSDTINDCDPNTGCLYYPCGDGQCNVGNINSEDASTCPEDCCTDSDGDGYYIDGGDCGPVDCDDSDPDVHPGASEACDDSIDNDCDGMTDCDDSECSDHPACECTFDNAYWSHEETTAGVRVKMTVEGTNCDGKEIMFNIYEDDLINDEDTSDEFVVKPKAVFDSGKAEAGWYAIYTPDGPGGLFDPPEYYFNAQLSEDSAVSIRSQGPGSNGLLKVWPNQRPYNETPFLIKPNGGEVYNESALVTWNPAIDPENDTIIYSLYYSNTSGNTWHGPIVQDYGFINTIEGEENLQLSFG